jgi:hypothetical protein
MGLTGPDDPLRQHKIWQLTVLRVVRAGVVLVVLSLLLFVALSVGLWLVTNRLLFRRMPRRRLHMLAAMMVFGLWPSARAGRAGGGWVGWTADQRSVAAMEQTSRWADHGATVRRRSRPCWSGWA